MKISCMSWAGKSSRIDVNVGKSRAFMHEAHIVVYVTLWVCVYADTKEICVATKILKEGDFPLFFQKRNDFHSPEPKRTNKDCNK